MNYKMPLYILLLFGSGFPNRSLAQVERDSAVAPGAEDAQGRALTDTVYSNMVVFQEKRVLIQTTVVTLKQEKQGLLDWEGRTIFPAEYAAIHWLTSAYFICLKDGAWALYAPDGRPLTPHQYRSMDAIPKAQIDGWVAQKLIPSGQSVAAAGIRADTGVKEILDGNGRAIHLN